MKLKPWQEYATDAFEAIVIGGVVFVGLVPGLPSHNWEVALAFGIVKAAPTGIVAQVIGSGGKANASKNSPT